MPPPPSTNRVITWANQSWNLKPCFHDAYENQWLAQFCWPKVADTLIPIYPYTITFFIYKAYFIFKLFFTVLRRWFTQTEYRWAFFTFHPGWKTFSRKWKQNKNKRFHLPVSHQSLRRSKALISVVIHNNAVIRRECYASKHGLWENTRTIQVSTSKSPSQQEQNNPSKQGTLIKTKVN